LLDAGRGEFYGAEFEGTSPICEGLFSQEDAVEAGSGAEITVVCEDTVVKALADRVAVQRAAEPTAADALPLALKRIAEASFDDVVTLDANYLRRTDAEIFAKPAARLG
jgi:tRNA threonylcarbamoyladenosine biosynthesis protein TsaB